MAYASFRPDRPDRHVRVPKYLSKPGGFSLALSAPSHIMAGHLLLAVFSFIVYFNAAYSAISARDMLVAVAQFSKDFTWPRINEVAYVHASYRPTASCLTE